MTNPENYVTVTKSYQGFPIAHRQPVHDGHCKLLHGHDLAFDFEFKAAKLDECGFVADFGKLKWLKNWLTHMFDHTLLIPKDDPQLALFKSLHDQGLCHLRIVPAASCELLAEWIFDEVTNMLTKQSGFYCVSAVTVHEGPNNKATYRV